MKAEIGNRVARTLPAGTTQKDIAAQVGMTPDAFSRALKGERGFSAVELANLAELLHVDVYFLITGAADPNRLVLAARHSYDPETRERAVAGHQEDRAILDDISLAYRQAGEDPGPSQIPQRLETTRSALGRGFARGLLAHIEDRFQIDIVRVHGLSTSYSFHITGRAVIAIPATGNWFRENWDMAHELGHLVLGHRCVMGPEGDVGTPEREANAFAADLLLPSDELSATDWSAITAEQLAHLAWVTGVSTQALSTRLRALHLTVSQQTSGLLGRSTQALLRRHMPSDSLLDEITVRMEDASQRHFPRWLQEAHLDRIAEGAIGKGTLAWMLGVDEAELDVEVPDVPPSLSASNLDDLLR